ncbi:MAG: hypothetical protein R2698_01720 [Microthrixaceae bacterium]
MDARRNRSRGEDAPSRPRTIANATRCPNCGDTVVEIRLVIDHSDLMMRSCSTCEVRSWHRGGEQVDLHGILADLSSSPTRYRRDLASR